MKKTTTLASMRETSNDELKTLVKRTEEELFQFRLKRYTNQLENTNLIRKSRRDIARAKTIVSQRTAGIEKGKE